MISEYLSRSPPDPMTTPVTYISLPSIHALPHYLQSSIRIWFTFFTSVIDARTAANMILTQSDRETEMFVECLRSGAHGDPIADFLIAVSPFTHTDTLTRLVSDTLKYPTAVRCACSCNPMTSIESLLILSVDPIADIRLSAEQALNSRIKSQTRVAESREWSLYHSALSYTLLCLAEQ